MKKLIFSLAAGLACAAFAQENLLKDGGFENIRKTPKASDKYIMSRIKMGWDFGPGPVAKIPANWVPNTGKVKFRVITVGENGENKENVAEGKNSIHVSGDNFHLYNASYLKPGKYKISFKYKGTGRVTVAFYAYGKDPKTGRSKHLTSRAPITAMAKANWQTLTREIEIGQWVPGIDRCTFVISGSKMDVYIDDIVVTPVK